MKSLLIVALIALCFSQTTFAKAHTKASGKSKLSTDHNLGAADVNGRYQMPVGTSVKAENEKELVDLLGVRKHFKDRLNTETTRN
jgi:hypothetical protein